jgi:hypothetical protein
MGESTLPFHYIYLNTENGLAGDPKRERLVGIMMLGGQENEHI